MQTPKIKYVEECSSALFCTRLYQVGAETFVT
jgi:hypothetical protein